MIIETPKVGVCGRFRLVIDGPDRREDTGWFNNLITDSGLNRLGEDNPNFRALNALDNARNMFGRFVLGGGSAEPRPTDTDLASLIVRAPGDIVQDSETCNYERGYYEFVCRYQFGEGVAAGNISEIGLQPTGKPLWCRALVLDADGNPTTITVRENEFLTVYYSYRMMIPKQDFVYNINVMYNEESVPTVVTIRPVNANRAGSLYDPSFTLRSYANIAGASAQRSSYTRFYNGGLADPTALNPLGSYISAGGMTVEQYITNSFKSSVTKSVDLNDWNNSDLSTFYDGGGQGAWQINFNPPLRKTNDQRMTFTTRYSWGRADVS